MSRHTTLRLSLFVLFFTFTTPAFSQTDSLVYFFDENFNSCTKDAAAYVGFGVKENGKIKFTNYRSDTGVPYMEGYFMDSTLGHKEGLFTFFDALGYPTTTGNYLNNMKEGYWLSWRNGLISDSVFFQKNEELLKIVFSHNREGKVVTRVLSNNMQKKSIVTTWYDNGIMQNTATWIDGTGDRMNYNEEGVLYLVESFQKGKNTSIKYYKEDGTEMTKEETKKFLKKRDAEFEKAMATMKELVDERTPEFPGGSGALKNYMEKHIRFPSRFINGPAGGERITVTFMLNESGYASDIKVVEFEDIDLREAIVSAFKRMPRWNMKGHKKYGPLTYYFNVK